MHDDMKSLKRHFDLLSLIFFLKCFTKSFFFIRSSNFCWRFSMFPSHECIESYVASLIGQCRVANFAREIVELYTPQQLFCFCISRTNHTNYQIMLYTNKQCLFHGFSKITLILYMMLWCYLYKYGVIIYNLFCFTKSNISQLLTRAKFKVLC